jgi:hypothetical protein
MFAPTHPLHHVVGGYHRQIHTLSPHTLRSYYCKTNAKSKPKMVKPKKM